MASLCPLPSARFRCCEDTLGRARSLPHPNGLRLFPDSFPVATTPCPRPRRIILVRHGQSEGNVDEIAYTRIPDPKIGLTGKGWNDAVACGQRIRDLIAGDGPDWKVYFYVSPYRRTRETLQGIGRAFESFRIAGVREEPRLREQDFGNFQDREKMRLEKKNRRSYGRFFYRFPNGESAADVYDRITGFRETLKADIDIGRFQPPGQRTSDMNLVIVSHGLTLRVFLMRWYKWTPAPPPISRSLVGRSATGAADPTRPRIPRRVCGRSSIPALCRRLSIRALDAAQPFDYESLASNDLSQRSRLKIAIVGFGNFGQFLARTFASQGHTLLAHSRTDHSAAARSLGASFFPDPHDLCEQHPDVVLLCSSILSAPAVLRSLPLQRLRRSTLFADVLSVKEFPKNLLLQHLPPGFDILCTHPMFGPESGKHGWAGLPFVYDKVRIGDSEDRIDRCNRFLEIFAREGCRMVEMSCGEHDETAAEIQFLTHTVGRVLAKLDLKPTQINTKGYEMLLNLVENTNSDSFDLYNGLFMYNKNSTELLERLDVAFDSLKKELYGKLHDVLRKQMFESPMKVDGPMKMDRVK